MIDKNEKMSRLMFKQSGCFFDENELKTLTNRVIST